MHLPPALALDARRIDAVVFDLDDTLIDWKGAEAKAFRDVAEGHLAGMGVAVPEAEAAYALVVQENYKSFRETGRWWFVQDRLRLLCTRLGLGDHAETLAASFLVQARRHLVWLPGAPEALAAARQGGRRTALLTNGFARVQRPKVEQFGLEPLVDFVGISEELGHWKPKPEAFHAVLDRLGVAPERALMVGDSVVFDLQTAKTLGMQTAWMGAWGVEPCADVALQSPGQLVPLLAPPRPARLDGEKA